MPAFYLLCIVAIGLAIVIAGNCYDKLGEIIYSWWSDFINNFKNKKEK